MLEMFAADPDDSISAHPQSITAKELFSPQDKPYQKWARNTYDPRSRSWLFGCSLHDDDWFNADPKQLINALADTKDEGDVDVVFAFVEWRKQLEAAWIVRPGSYSTVEALPALPEPAGDLLLEGNLEEAERTIGSAVVTRWKTWG